jgi:RNA polymerase sigma-70 factor, ECF subfamily
MTGAPVTDVEAFFDEHRNGVFRYLRHIVGQADVAQDLTQEVFLRVSRAPPPETDDPRRRAWLFTVARNVALNHLRDRQRRPPSVPLADAVAPATQELSVAIGQALDALSIEDRHVFLMREIAGLSYQEIAAACELSVEAVRSRLRRARQELRTSLSGPIATHRARGVTLGRGEG